MVRFMLASRAGSGAGIPARMAGFRTGAAITWGSGAIGAAAGRDGAMAIRGVGTTLDCAPIGDGTMLDGVAIAAMGTMLEAIGDGAMLEAIADGAMLEAIGDGVGMTLMAAMLSARAAGSGGGIPASTEGSRAAGGEAATS